MTRKRPRALPGEAVGCAATLSAEKFFDAHLDSVGRELHKESWELWNDAFSRLSSVLTIVDPITRSTKRMRREINETDVIQGLGFLLQSLRKVHLALDHLQYDSSATPQTTSNIRDRVWSYFALTVEDLLGKFKLGTIEINRSLWEREGVRNRLCAVFYELLNWPDEVLMRPLDGNKALVLGASLARLISKLQTVRSPAQEGLISRWLSFSASSERDGGAAAVSGRADAEHLIAKAEAIPAVERTVVLAREADPVEEGAPVDGEMTEAELLAWVEEEGIGDYGRIYYSDAWAFRNADMAFSGAKSSGLAPGDS